MPEQNEGITVLRREGLHRLVKYPSGSFKTVDGYGYRSETFAGPFLVGTTYDTLEEAQADYEDSIRTMRLER